jgi:hypothetical protein
MQGQAGDKTDLVSFGDRRRIDKKRAGVKIAGRRRPAPA